MSETQRGTPSSIPPTRMARLAAVAGFFFVLFLMAGMLGLPVRVELVVAVFLTIVAPAAALLVLALVAAVGVLGRITGRSARIPLFDLALQAFVLVSLVATGVFLARFPDWLREESYPMLRAQIRPYLSPEHTRLERERFWDALQRFTGWSVPTMLYPDDAPSLDEQEQAGTIWQALLTAGQAECEDCPPQFTREETSRFVALVDAMIPPTEMTAAQNRQRMHAARAMPAPVTGAAAVTAPAEAAPDTGEAAAAPVTSPAGAPVP